MSIKFLLSPLEIILNHFAFAGWQSFNATTAARRRPPKSRHRAYKRSKLVGAEASVCQVLAHATLGRPWRCGEAVNKNINHAHGADEIQAMHKEIEASRWLNRHVAATATAKRCLESRAPYVCGRHNRTMATHNQQAGDWPKYRARNDIEMLEIINLAVLRKRRRREEHPAFARPSMLYIKAKLRLSLAADGGDLRLS